MGDVLVPNAPCTWARKGAHILSNSDDFALLFSREQPWQGKQHRLVLH
jgi:hypothetical protein